MRYQIDSRLVIPYILVNVQPRLPAVALPTVQDNIISQ